ncbi:hypothetical protein [Bradyrhizobium sp.]|jgi:hypothetical protein|uniref:hypothetical protein n=1 Tax=Bradyrhizobium sp. TaxID=376 RepID=UPI003BAEA421
MLPKAVSKPVMLRLPADVKTWLEQEAARMMASQNSEIVRCLRARMDADKRAAQRERATG